MTLRLLSAADVRQALPMAQAIAGMKAAFGQLSNGQANMPLRARVEAQQSGSTLIMPAYLPQSSDLAVKVVSVFPQNGQLGLPIIHALVLALDAQTGRPLAMLEGGTLTAIRTGAGAGAATDLLARHDARIVAIIGSGVQARTQLEAVCTVRDVDEVRVFSPNQLRAAAFAAEVAGHGPIPAQIQVVGDAETAVTGADIICAATTASTPVFNGRNLKPGAHVNGVGSFLPTMQEVDTYTVQQALVVVDSVTAVLAEAGDLLVPLRDGLITQEHFSTELGDIVNGRKPGRTNAQQITFFKSVGVAVQDAVAAGIALKNAGDHDLGMKISW